MNKQPTAAQTVAWNPANFVGYGDAELALIRTGFVFGLGRAHEEEERRGDMLGVLRAVAGDVLASPGVTFRDQMLRHRLGAAVQQAHAAATQLHAAELATVQALLADVERQVHAYRADVAGLLAERDTLREQLDAAQRLATENARLVNAVQRLSHPAADDGDLADAQQLLEDIRLGHVEGASA